MKPRNPAKQLSYAALRISAFVCLLGASTAAASAQVVSSPNGTPQVLPNVAEKLIADNVVPAPEQIDLTPVRLPERGTAFGPIQNLKTGILYYLPSKMFFDATVENTFRLETNVLQTRARQHVADVYRVFPNVTLGYSFNRTTRISANYFFFRDQYSYQSNLLSRNIHSIGLQGNKDFILGPRTTLTTGLLWRQLLITNTHELNDIIPSATVVRRVGNGGAIYASTLLQTRMANVTTRFQENDQFYSLGGLYRTPNWTYVWDNTLVDNFGVAKLRGGAESNHQIIMTLEAGRKISSRLPLVAFVRAQPIFNMGNDKRVGYAGFNFRLFGGIRAEVSKPAIFPVKLRSS